MLSGHLLAVDNDPDSRPPCRLLDVVEQGDYGFKFRYGRSGLHPFIAWNGELPGTLPMMSSTGEAPSGLLDCDSAKLPSRFRGAVLVTNIMLTATNCTLTMPNIQVSNSGNSTACGSRRQLKVE